MNVKDAMAELALELEAIERMSASTKDPVLVALLRERWSRTKGRQEKLASLFTDAELTALVPIDTLVAEIRMTRAAQALTSEPVPEVETASGENVT